MEVDAHPVKTPAPLTPPPGAEPDRPAWPASAGLLGLLLALVGTGVLSGALAGIYIAIGFDNPEDAPSFEFAAIAAQSAVFIGAALVMTAQAGRPTARQFGFRPFKGSALGWAFLALIVFLILQAIYAVLANPSPDDLPQDLGADKSTALAIVTGFFVVGVAPPVEEFFFRGFLYQSLRNRIGIWGGAALSGLIFGAIHFKFEFLVPLAILGVILAGLFEKTGSLWPCILLHSLYNGLAYTAALTS
jgi:membrane protease YdiL (CAAX protease family)